MTISSFHLGLDFGTTNSVASLPTADGATKAVVFPREGAAEAVFPSLLTLWQDDDLAGKIVTRVEGGQWALDAFRAHAPDCRFLKSIKSFAASANFSSTMIYGHRYDFPTLMRIFLERMQAHCEPKTGWKDGAVLIGRPVRFAGVNADERVAMTRYRTALEGFGFSDVRTVYEPLAAAYHFVRGLQGEATIFVGDLGGGTSDFSILRVVRRDGKLTATPLTSRGIGIAGDQLDARIIQHTIARALGRGSQYRSFGKQLEIPGHYFSKLTQWHELSRLRGGETYREIKGLRAKSLEPERLDRFLQFIEGEMHYDLFAAVSEAKRTLSSEEAATLRMNFGGDVVECHFSRSDFNRWIESDLNKLDALIDVTLADAQLQASEIDTVFLTGGTSFVPAIRGMFESRFGSAAIESSDQLISVANGLALIASDGAALAWSTDRL